MTDGVIVKALSGFYYVETEGKLLECKARGKFRLDGTSPLVGDRVSCSLDANGKGRIDHVEPRRNWSITCWSTWFAMPTFACARVIGIFIPSFC